MENGATVDKADNNGRTPLLYAAANNYIEVISLLLENGATVDKAEKDGFTPLHFLLIRIIMKS